MTLGQRGSVPNVERPYVGVRVARPQYALAQLDVDRAPRVRRL